ncbi:amino acid adenylation domain-containing protein [Bacteroides sp.]|uniref:amino acid adenylation domain-containing protein n=1 Tax=Bacteroides sp. TaxID=29523 RepID=UPI00258786C7|nr:amino acid adenylation domain-containing protein [Bacteroides sp.]
MKKNDADMLADIFQASNRYAMRPALVLDDRTYTYQELFGLAGSISETLRNLKEDIIGIMAENSMETYASILAVLFSGKTYVMLHPDYPAERNCRIARQSGIGLLLYSGENGNILPADISARRVSFSSYRPTSYSGIVTYDVASDVTAYIIFTSGSTGEPKGVPISRKNLNAFYQAYSALGLELDENDRMLQMFELTFDVSVVSFLYPLTLGACVYAVPQKGMKYLNVLDIMERHRLTFAAVAPSVLRLSRPYFGEISFPDLRYLIVTAEATDVNLLDEFRPCIPNAKVINLYGPTEATIYCTSYVIPAEGAKHHNGMAAIGKPFQGMDYMIASPSGKQTPTGETGELWIAGPQLMRGYWCAPEKTAECFVTDSSGKLYYRTGDLCLADNHGDIIYCGRKDTQVKIQGFRIELGEIEYHVKAFYRHTCNALVLPVYTHAGNCELHLFIEKDAEDTEILERYMQSHLPSYMLPRHIHFIHCFPQNNSNKIDRNQLLKYITQ